MTAHELARQLLAGPDLRAAIHFSYQAENSEYDEIENIAGLETLALAGSVDDEQIVLLNATYKEVPYAINGYKTNATPFKRGGGCRYGYTVWYICPTFGFRKYYGRFATKVAAQATADYINTHRQLPTPEPIDESVPIC